MSASDQQQLDPETAAKVEALYREANAARQAGQIEGAAEKCRAVLELEPESPAALQFLSSLAFNQKNYAEAEKHLSTMVGANPMIVPAWQGLGLAREAQGNPEEAIPAYQKAIYANPDGPDSWIYLAAAHLEAGRANEAAACFSFAIDLYPKAKLFPNNPQVAGPVRYRMAQGEKLLMEVHEKLHGAAIEKAKKDFPGADYSRIEKARWRKLWDPNVKLATREQQPMGFYVEGLDPRPWFERSEFDWAEEFEAKTDMIREEVAGGFDPDKDLSPYLVEGATDPTVWGDMIGNMKWGSLHFWNGRLKNGEAARRMPKTIEAVEALPLFRIGGKPVEVLLSVMQPETRIPPHFGMTNARLTVHLPLVVPENCFVKAGGEERRAEAGKLLFFDDSFRHEAWNDSLEPRIHLIFECWHPDVEDHEKAVIAESFLQYEKWMTGRDIKGLMGPAPDWAPERAKNPEMVDPLGD